MKPTWVRDGDWWIARAAADCGARVGPSLGGGWVVMVWDAFGADVYYRVFVRLGDAKRAGWRELTRHVRSALRRRRMASCRRALRRLGL